MSLTSLTVMLNQQVTASTSDFSTLPRFGVYVILSGNKVLRVGESSSGETRLLKGFRDPFRRVVRKKDRKNYIAYAWRTNYAGKKLRVDYFELGDQRFADNHFRRALEAEVTFQFRIAQKYWPLEMSEVHFLEVHRTDGLLVKTATAILSHYAVRYDAAA